MTRYRNSLQAVRLTACSASTGCGNATGRTSSKRSHLYCSRPLRRKSKTLHATLWELSNGSTIAARVPGILTTEPGMNSALNWQTLTTKYLTREDRGIWSTDGQKVRAMYRALKRLDASEQTIFLLAVELGNIAEVARRLNCHRSTVTRIYNKIRNKISDEVGRY